MKKQIADTLKALKQGVAGERKLTSKDFVSSGCTALNKAITGKAGRGYAKGSYTLVVGDSSAGKTFLALTALAEASVNPNFDDYLLVYDATTEDGAQMDIGRMFGPKLAERLIVVRSNTAQEFYYNLDNFLKRKKPIIYVCDSENGLDSDAAEDKFQKQKKAHETGKDVPGSYGDGKAKIHSENLRRVCSKLTQTESILIVLSQTRDNIDPFSFETKTRAGGRALKFYAQVEYWISVRENLKKSVHGKPRQIGILSQIKVKKTRYTGKVREASVFIYYSVGVDDIGSCITYLIDEGHWTGNKTQVTAPEFKFKGEIAGLIAKIEERNMQKDLSALVSEVWDEIESKCAVERKPKYT